MIHAIRRDYNKTTHKRCIKCRMWKPRFDILDGDEVVETKAFGDHEDSSDGLQSICYACKNVATKKARERSPTQRIRHHTGTRCLTQLGKFAPKGFVANMEEYLGYKIATLVRHLSKDLKEREGKKLRDALNEGYHIDHIHPLSQFPVVVDGEVDWDAFRECWAIDNLRAIPAAENLEKGAKVQAE